MPAWHSSVEGLRKFLGTVKDGVSVSLAKVNSPSETKDIEVAFLKATTHDDNVPDERYVSQVIYLTGHSRPAAFHCIGIIARRLAKTHTWAVALKTLLVTHRLLRDGNVVFQDALASYHLNMATFRDVSGLASAWDFASFVRHYAAYLEGYLQGNKALVGTDDTRLQRLPLLQEWMEKLLLAEPHGVAMHHPLVLRAMYLMVTDSVQMYREICDGMTGLLPEFAEMETKNAIQLLEICRTAQRQFQKLEDLYSLSRQHNFGRQELPEVVHVQEEHIQALADYVEEIGGPKAVKSTSSFRRSMSVDERGFNKGGRKSERDLLPSEPAGPRPMEDKRVVDEARAASGGKTSPSRGGNAAKTQSLGVADEPDFLGIKEPVAAPVQPGDEMALTLFSGVATTKVVGADSWATFGSPKKAGGGGGGDGVRSASPASVLGGFGTVGTGQELALVSADGPKLAGGFDNLLLDSLYEDAETRKRTYGVAHPGQVYTAAPPSTQSTNPFLAGPVAPNDPFAPSANIAPPPWVQMQAMQQAHSAVVAEQMAWAQYQQSGYKAPINPYISNNNPNYAPVSAQTFTPYNNNMALVMYQS